MAVLGDFNMKVKEIDTHKKCTDHQVKVFRIWVVQAIIIPGLIESLEAKPSNLNSYIEKIGIKPSTPLKIFCERCCLLKNTSTARFPVGNENRAKKHQRQIRWN